VCARAGLEPGDDLRVVAVGPGRIELAKVEDVVSGLAETFDAGLRGAHAELHAEPG
jgi:hypothetical protein